MNLTDLTLEQLQCAKNNRVCWRFLDDSKREMFYAIGKKHCQFWNEQIEKWQKGHQNNYFGPALIYCVHPDYYPDHLKPEPEHPETIELDVVWKDTWPETKVLLYAKSTMRFAKFCGAGLRHYHNGQPYRLTHFLIGAVASQQPISMTGEKATKAVFARMDDEVAG